MQDKRKKTNEQKLVWARIQERKRTLGMKKINNVLNK